MNDQRPGFWTSIAYLAMIAVLWPLDKFMDWYLARPLSQKDLDEIARRAYDSPRWWGVWVESKKYGIGYWKRQYTRGHKWVPLQTLPGEAQRIADALNHQTLGRAGASRFFTYTPMIYDGARAESNAFISHLTRRPPTGQPI